MSASQSKCCSITDFAGRLLEILSVCLSVLGKFLRKFLLQIEVHVLQVNSRPQECKPLTAAQNNLLCHILPLYSVWSSHSPHLSQRKSLKNKIKLTENEFMVSAKNVYINSYAWATGNPSKNTRYFILLCFYDTHYMYHVMSTKVMNFFL